MNVKPSPYMMPLTMIVGAFDESMARRASLITPKKLVYCARSKRLFVAGIEVVMEPQCVAVTIAIGSQIDRHLHRDELIDCLWGDREDGGPLTAQKQLRVQINKARTALEPHGAYIRSQCGRGYYLEIERKSLDNHLFVRRKHFCCTNATL